MRTSVNSRCFSLPRAPSAAWPGHVASQSAKIFMTNTHGVQIIHINLTDCPNLVTFVVCNFIYVVCNLDSPSLPPHIHVVHAHKYSDNEANYKQRICCHALSLSSPLLSFTLPGLHSLNFVAPKGMHPRHQTSVYSSSNKLRQRWNTLHFN